MLPAESFRSSLTKKIIGYISIHACEHVASGVVQKLIDEKNELAGLHQEEEYDTEEEYDIEESYE